MQMARPNSVTSTPSYADIILRSFSPFAPTFSEPFRRYTEPFCGFLSTLKYAHGDRRIFSDYGMQLAIMNDGGISRQNRRLHGQAVAVGKDSMERNLNDVSEIQLDLIVAQRVEKSIERLL